MSNIESGSSRQGRLCAKTYAGRAAIEILLVKGYSASDVVRDAEDLAAHGLRASQIQRLTSLPECNCRQLVEKVGIANWTGRQKKSIRDLLMSPSRQMTVSAFLELIQNQLEMTAASRLVSSHVLAAIHAFEVRCRRLTDIDWERMTHAAFSMEDGDIALVECRMCGTHHLAHRDVTSDRTCPLCRVAASMTKIAGKTATATRFHRVERKNIPGEVGAAGRRRARLHVALDADLPDSGVTLANPA